MGQLREGVEATYRRALLLTGGFAAASIFLALVLGFVISWSFILPVREAEGFLGQVAKGDFSASIDVPNRDEFGALARRMNQMSRELHQLYEDQRRAAHQLRALNAELEQASQAKSDFLASMSHELRTPMNAILGFTEMILDDVYGDVPPEIREPVADIHTCGKQLLGLINDVLDLSKIEAGRMELALGEYVGRGRREHREALAALAGRRRRGWTSSPPCRRTCRSCFGDGKRITQCLMNLAGNALKFTREGRVEIRVELQGDALLFGGLRHRDRHPRRTSSSTSSRSSGRRTPPSPGSSAGPGSAFPSRRSSSSCTAGGSGWRARRGRDRRSSSRSRREWRGRRPREDDPVRRGQRVQPQDRPAPARPAPPIA